MVDIQRGTTGVNLPAEVAAEIWTNVTEQSVVQKAAKRVTLPGNGVATDIIATEATASWVLETAVKPLSRPTVSSKLIQPYTISVIVPFSNQFRRDKAGLYAAIVEQLPAAIAKKFDQTVFGYFSAPGANFDTLAASPTVSINTAGTAYAGLVSAFGTIAAAGGDMSAVIGSSQFVAKLLAEVDDVGRPLFDGNLAGLNQNLLGVQYLPSKHVHRAAGGAGVNQILGIAGDWAGSAVWGQVGGINVSISDQATVTDTDGTTNYNLWQRNMFAVRVETELGFAVKDDDRFVRITGTPGA